ncbi:zinc finger protein 501-like isoform X2 [Cheilinus undulatus]|uniref:zinc finger protein 501-like isoform X2 n=1 Tax=Cheilinus undulatus TaxID=241271 RepID=UPI001BD320C1|nr:zinc finger protein 501-like isoform X2 [Cheilinus undulatus]
MSRFQDLSGMNQHIPGRNTVFPDEVQQLSVSNGVSSEHQERSCSLNQEITEPPHIKEEPEELWSSQEGEQLQSPEEDDVIKFTFVPATVKSEDDDEKPQASQLHYRQTDELETEADREDYEGLEAARYCVSKRDLQPEIEVKTEDSSDTETDDSADWKGTTQRWKGSNWMENIKTRRRKTDKKSHSCSECGKIFDQKGHLTNHMRIHTGEKPFSCSECSKSFAQYGNLTKHMLVHSRQKPFSCAECGERFVKENSLTKHMRLHLGERPYGCSECSKSFSIKGQLTQHMRIHTGEKPYSCSVCCRRFTQQGTMSKHMRIHTGEKPFSCSECDKKFRQKLHLTLHMAHHRGEKLICCNVCERRFSWHSSLRNHRCNGYKDSELNENQTEESREAKPEDRQEDCVGYSKPGAQLQIDIYNQSQS